MVHPRGGATSSHIPTHALGKKKVFSNDLPRKYVYFCIFDTFLSDFCLGGVCFLLFNPVQSLSLVRPVWNIYKVTTHTLKLITTVPRVKGKYKM